MEGCGGGVVVCSSVMKGSLHPPLLSPHVFSLRREAVWMRSAWLMAELHGWAVSDAAFVAVAAV